MGKFFVFWEVEIFCSVRLRTLLVGGARRGVYAFRKCRLIPPHQSLTRQTACSFLPTRGEAVATATDEGGSICTYKRHTLSLRIPPTNRARSRTLQKSPTSPNDKNFPPRAPAPYKAKQNFALHRRVLLGEVPGGEGGLEGEEAPFQGGSFSLQGLPLTPTQKLPCRVGSIDPFRQSAFRDCRAQ